MRNIRIGDYLVEEGHITPEQLQQVLQRQRESTDQKKFGEVIVEMGFMTNPDEDLYLASEEGQKAIAEGLANGIDAYFAEYPKTME